VFEPDDDEIRDELITQSLEFFEEIGLGGVVGPSMEQFDRERPDHWPSCRTILGRFGLLRKVEGWRLFLMAYGFAPPTPADVQASSHRRRNPSGEERYRIPDRDDDYPGLMGSHVGDEVVLTPIGDGLAIRTTRSIIQLR
jgi:hypothetical protein